MLDVTLEYENLLYAITILVTIHKIFYEQLAGNKIVLFIFIFLHLFESLEHSYVIMQTAVSGGFTHYLFKI